MTLLSPRGNESLRCKVYESASQLLAACPLSRVNFCEPNAEFRFTLAFIWRISSPGPSLTFDCLVEDAISVPSMTIISRSLLVPDSIGSARYRRRQRWY